MSKKKKKRFTPIFKHKQEKGTLKTKGSEMPIEWIDWERDLMPEHIWIDLLAEDNKDKYWHKIYEEFLDRLDSCLESERKDPFFGFISDFGELTIAEREKFLSQNKDFIHKYFFLPVGKILSFYPETPANWLVLEEWKDKEKINFEVELNKLASSLSRLIKAKDEYAGHIRTLPITRLFKHGKIYLPNGGMPDLVDALPRYPYQCTQEEKMRVQQFSRIQMNMIFMSNERYKTKSWPQYFWRHNYDLVPCNPIEHSLSKGDEISDEGMRALQAKLWDNCVILMKYLDKVGMQYKYDLYDPTIDEIKLGVFSRIIRLYISFVANPFLWNRDLSGIMLRCIGETTILFFYLITKATVQEFCDFKEYSQGKEKLLMLHLQDNLKDEKTIEGLSIDDIADELGGGMKVEFMDIELKQWTKKDIRQMAKDGGLENIYRWVIDPSSAELHGSWSSIRKSNLVVCTQILHRFHRVPKFYEPPIYLVSLFVAEQIYLRAQKLGIEKLGFPQPDEQLSEIEEIKAAYDRHFCASNV